MAVASTEKLEKEALAHQQKEHTAIAARSFCLSTVFPDP
jgi:hypothetical protein